MVRVKDGAILALEGLDVSANIITIEKKPRGKNSSSGRHKLMLSMMQLLRENNMRFMPSYKTHLFLFPPFKRCQVCFGDSYCKVIPIDVPFEGKPLPYQSCEIFAETLEDLLKGMNKKLLLSTKDLEKLLITPVKKPRTRKPKLHSEERLDNSLVLN